MNLQRYWVNQVRMYYGGKEPAVSSARVRDEFTSQASRAAAHRMSGELQLYQAISTWPQPDPEHMTVAMVPRFLFRVGSQPVRNGVLVYDYYARATVTDPGHYTETIRLPPDLQPGTRLVVDPQGHVQQRFRIRNGQREYVEGRGRMVGFIVSVFDGDGTLVYQRANDRRITDLARARPP